MFFFPTKWCHFTFTNVKLDFRHLFEGVESASLIALKECKLPYVERKSCLHAF